MMPVECASMRSIARCVLPVLVGPSTAVTPAPRARASRLAGCENETAIGFPVSVSGDHGKNRSVMELVMDSRAAASCPAAPAPLGAPDASNRRDCRQRPTPRRHLRDPDDHLPVMEEIGETRAA